MHRSLLAVASLAAGVAVLSNAAGCKSDDGGAAPGPPSPTRARRHPPRGTAR